MKQLCLGYDLRLPIQNDSLVIPSYLEEQCLVSKRIQLSGDPNVWPNTLDVANLIYGHIWILSNPLGLANNINILIKNCRDRGIDTDEMVAVALTCFEENFIALNERYGTGWLGELVVSEDELKISGWDFVGFDILDLNGLISGLSGCGYKPSSKHELQAIFADALNDVGLFDSSLSALRFANVRALQIPQHAPFTIVGIWIKSQKNELNQSVNAVTLKTI
jgi:hypothetical protein